MNEWTRGQVSSWLNHINMPHLIPLFSNNEVDGATLLHLSAEDLRVELAIANLVLVLFSFSHLMHFIYTFIL